MNRAETAALSPQQKATADQQHQGSGDLAGQHGGDGAQQPAEGFQDPVDRLQIGPDGGPQQRRQQAQSGGEQPALYHQAGLQPANGPLGSGHQIPSPLIAHHPGLASACWGLQRQGTA